MSDIEIDILNNPTPEIDLDNISSTAPEISLENISREVPSIGAVALYGPQGNGISTIVKTSTTGLVDTYTITFTDGNTTTYTVTNGNGIADISKTSTSGLVDTYTITFDNGDTDTFTVTNGKDGIDGVDGQDGISPTAEVTQTAGGATITITDVSGTTTADITNGTDGVDGQDGQAATITVGSTTTGQAGTSASVTNSGTSSAAILDFIIPKGDKGDTGNTGATGNGISSITKTSTSGLVDTYTIDYTNGNDTTFDVTNGKDGTNGQDGAAATIAVGTVSTGAAGSSATVVNSGTSSAAVFDFTIPKGDKGNTGDTGPQGVSVTGVSLISTVGLAKTYRMAFSNSNYFDYVVMDGAAGSTQWGAISGVLSNQTDLKNALDLKYDASNPNGYITGIGSTDVITALGYTPYDSSNPNGYITGITSTDVTTALGYTPYDSSNPNGYTTNVGTVTSVNNTSPDSNGNVSLTIPTQTDVQINGTSITSGGVANILTNSAYSSSNKLATMGDVPSTSGLANTDLSNLSSTGEAHFLKNESTATNSITILGTPTTSGMGSINIGITATAGNNATSLGYIAQASGGSSLAIGSNATASGNSAIQLGSGTNSTGNSLSVGFTQAATNYQLLDGTTGLIPDARLSSNIARTSQIPSTSGLANTSLSNLSSTGKKVLDGQWVNNYLSVSTATSVGSREHSLSAYLPSDTYSYEVIGVVNGASSNTSTCVVGNVASPNSSNNCIKAELKLNTNARRGAVQFITVVDSNRKIYSQISDSAFSSSCGIYLYGYRRIGTNT